MVILQIPPPPSIVHMVYGYPKDAFDMQENITFSWKGMINETYINEAGWYFKTLATQEMGKFSLFKFILRDVNSFLFARAKGQLD